MGTAHPTICVRPDFLGKARFRSWPWPALAGRRRLAPRSRGGGTLGVAPVHQQPAAPSQTSGRRDPQTLVDREQPARGAGHRLRRRLAPPTRPQRRSEPRHHPPPDPEPPPPRHIPETRHQSQTLRLHPRSQRPATNLPTTENRCAGPGAGALEDSSHPTTYPTSKRHWLQPRAHSFPGRLRLLSTGSSSRYNAASIHPRCESGP